MDQVVGRSLVAMLLSLGTVSSVAGRDAAPGIHFFESRIRPVLVEACYECHSAEAENTEGELALDNRASVARGGQSGAVVLPGKPEQSLLLRALRYDDDHLQMPPSGKLSDEIIADFRRWIEMGAPDPREGELVAVKTIASRAAEHWAFQPPTRPKIPPQTSSSWPTHAMDRLILRELQAAGLAPTKPASREALIRRLFFDLVGLPPSWQEIEEFVANDSPNAYGNLVDQLLASPQFGERWARHWLDVARFADTKGYVFTEDRTFPNAYKYRDWVINAFNDDLPIDEFFNYQIAADQLVEEDDSKHHLAAQGYVTLGRRFINNQHDIIDDRIDVVFRGMMGLTVSCARCHDHKFDPISAEDYYALYGMFSSSQEQQDDDLPLRLIDKEKPSDVGVFIRGNAHNRGSPVARGFPTFFTAAAVPIRQGSGRLELARAITHSQNPLTARVFVNRVWGHLFGEQLVRTPSDFGLRSNPPRQQAVLDLLATEFMDHGWSLKWLVRELVTSSTYRQSSEIDPALALADPENELWGRMNRRRVDFEAMRDRLLKVSGRLNEAVGGPSERIDTPGGGSRKTLYAHIDRQNLPGLFRTFDFASPDAHSPERPHTLVPQQALFLLNSSTMHAVTQQLAESLSSEEPAQQVTDLYLKVLGRRPDAEELQLAINFVNRRAPEQLPEDEWSFGYGAIAERNQLSVVELKPLTHFVSNRWQGSQEYPEKTFGHLSVTVDGGHPGDQTTQCSVRRWTAPEAGKLIIAGQLKHPSDKGDGILASIVSSRRGVLASWTLKHGEQKTALELPRIEPQEKIDFLVGCRKTPSYDTYQWDLSLALETTAGWKHWSSKQDFHGPRPQPLSLWAQLAQVLLMSNEFHYVD